MKRTREGLAMVLDDANAAIEGAALLAEYVVGAADTHEPDRAKALAGIRATLRLASRDIRDTSSQLWDFDLERGGKE